MTQPRFLRRARVEIGGAPGTTLLVVEDLRINFDLRNDAHSSPPSSKVQIYNLAPRSDSLISSEGQPVVVMAGYGDRIALIAQGEIRRVDRERRGLERVTSITLGASDKTRTEAVISKTYQRVHIRTIVSDLVLDYLGLRLGPMTYIPNLVINSFVAEGKAEDELKRLLEPYQVEPYETLGEIRFARQNIPADRRSFSLSEATGLIGTPTVTEKGARAKMALNNEIELDQPVYISSSVLTGWYKVVSLAHRGDTWDGEFVTEIEASAIA